MAYMVWIVVSLINASKNKLNSNIHPKPVSILIAVRNEAKNIVFLIDQILHQSYALFEVIIIDDHSTDETISILQNNEHLKIKWYQLPEGMEGKKAAIKFGLTKCQYPWIIMTDADVKLKKDWLSSYVCSIYEEAFIVAPVFVEVNKPSLFSIFQQLDYAAMQYITIATIFANKPFICSGANIAIPKGIAIKLYETIDTSIPSGDDVFLLHNHVKQKGKVTVNIFPSSALSVNANINFSNFIHQRLRWASKAKYYKNTTAIFISIITFLVHFALLVGLVWGFILPPLLQITFILLIIKMIIDLPLFIIGNKIISLHKKWLLYYPFVSFTYFLYISTIAIGSFFYSIKWKNRTWINGSKKENK